MGWDRTATDWQRFKERARDKWGKLSDEQLDATAGRRDSLSAIIQRAYDLSSDEAEEQIKDFEQINNDPWPVGKP